MRCKECREKIPDDVKYCPECGALINENVTYNYGRYTQQNKPQINLSLNPHIMKKMKHHAHSLSRNPMSV